MSAVGFLDFVGGALVVFGIFAAFMVWAIFPLLPFLVMGAIYATVRHGVPALGRAAVAVERGAVAAVRWVLHPVAVWALRGREPAYVKHGDGKGRR
jgi:hypothetical protein